MSLLDRNAREHRKIGGVGRLNYLPQLRREISRLDPVIARDNASFPHHAEQDLPELVAGAVTDRGQPLIPIGFGIKEYVEALERQVQLIGEIPITNDLNSELTHEPVSPTCGDPQ